MYKEYPQCTLHSVSPLEYISSLFSYFLLKVGLGF